MAIGTDLVDIGLAVLSHEVICHLGVTLQLFGLIILNEDCHLVYTSVVRYTLILPRRLTVWKVVTFFRLFSYVWNVIPILTETMALPIDSPSITFLLKLLLLIYENWVFCCGVSELLESCLAPRQRLSQLLHLNAFLVGFKVGWNLMWFEVILLGWSRWLDSMWWIVI